MSFSLVDRSMMARALQLAEQGLWTTSPNPRVGCVLWRDGQIVGEGWHEERTGLHETEFIETRRHWFSAKVSHDTGQNLNVLNLIEGREALVESPDGAFEPFVVHYAETFIIPASVGAYTTRPYGEGLGKECGTIKAFVRS